VFLVVVVFCFGCVLVETRGQWLAGGVINVWFQPACRFGGWRVGLVGSVGGSCPEPGPPALFRVSFGDELIVWRWGARGGA